MSKGDGDGALDFVRRQFEILRRQCNAIEHGDLVTARTAGNQLKRSTPALMRLVRRKRGAQGTADGEAETIEGIVAEMKGLVEKATTRLVSSRDNMAQLLLEFRRGRQVLAHYHSGRKAESRLFDIRG